MWTCILIDMNRVLEAQCNLNIQLQNDTINVVPTSPSKLHPYRDLKHILESSRPFYSASLYLLAKWLACQEESRVNEVESTDCQFWSIAYCHHVLEFRAILVFLFFAQQYTEQWLVNLQQKSWNISRGISVLSAISRASQTPSFRSPSVPKPLLAKTT